MAQSPASDLAAIKAHARSAALALGAADLRVSAANDDDATRDAMARAFERGDFATWRYDRDYALAAASPRSILAGARSVISIAVAYATPAPAWSPLRGRVSNYAWSSDYHRRMKQLLATIADGIDREAGAPVSAIACDTKPLAERAFAARAGLGWIGKHTNLISPAAGSFVFLGEIVTTLELPPDPPLRKSCGSCTRCVAACPTGALRGDYTIDAVRCISDLTQRTGGIPREMRPLAGLWVWGCDLCQLICPPTMRSPVQTAAHNRPIGPAAGSPELTALLRLRSSEFKRTYARTAMGWRGAAVLRRNAAVALGNALDRASVPALCDALAGDPHPMVRGHAAWALGRIGSPPALARLRERLARETSAPVREEIAAALEPFAPARPLKRI